MTRVRFRVRKYLDGDPSPALAYAELSGSGITGSKQFLVPVTEAQGKWVESEVPAGHYLIQVRLPSGATVDHEFEVPDSTKPWDVVFDAPHSAYEHLSWPQLFGSLDVDFTRPELESRRDMLVDLLGTWQVDPPASFELHAGLPGFGHFIPVEHGTSLTFADDHGTATYDVRTRRDEENAVLQFVPRATAAFTPVAIRGPVFLSINGVPGGPQGAALPLPWFAGPERRPIQLDLLVHYHGIRLDRRVSAAVVIRDTGVPAALAYLEHGQLAAVHAMLESVRQMGQDIQQRHDANPYAAAAAGLILLRTREYDALREWPATLALRFPWLPDGAILNATCLLLGVDSEGEPQIQGARSALLQGLSRGFPIYSASLRLAIDAVRRSQLAGQDDAELAGVLRGLRQIARDVDWSQPYMTFHRVDFAFTSPTSTPMAMLPANYATGERAGAAGA